MSAEQAAQGPPHIVVVGGGLAGAAAAHRLARRGARVTLLERSAALGGRARHESRDGFVFDVGAHLIGARDGALRALAEEAGLGARLLPLRPAALAWAHARGLRYGGAPGWRGVARLPGMTPRSALRLLRLGRWLRRFEAVLDPARPERAARLDDRSLADFMGVYFGRPALERWAAPLVAELGAEPEEASRALFALQLAARQLAPVGTLRDGVGHLPAALARSAHAVHLAAEVLEVTGAPGAPQVVVARGGREETLRADAVVVAAPAAETARLAAPLLERGEREALAAGETAEAVVLAAGLAGARLGRATRIRVPRAEGHPFHVVHAERGRPRAPEGAELVVAVAGPAVARAQRRTPDEVLAKDMLAGLAGVLPGGLGEVRMRALRRIPGAWPRLDVGRVRAIARVRRIGAARRAEGRRLYLAGDHLTLPTLEGAARSGLRAAEEAAADLGLAAGSEDGAGGRGA